jgi:ABC-type transport system involved in multi-copper enzyme maturation permease subunit
MASSLLSPASVAAHLRHWCGPVVWYDVVRTARRGRYAWARILYGFVLFCLINIEAQLLDQHPGKMAGGELAAARELAQLATIFFGSMVMFQFTAVIVLTPAYAASAITEEKERKTLDYLLVTQFSAAEIILGKVASRVVNLSFLLLTGLPVIALLQLLGGIDPQILTISFAATMLLVLSLTCLGVLCSVYARRTVRAIVVTYLWLLIYFVGLPVIEAWLTEIFGNNGLYGLIFQPIMEFINIGNPFYSFERIFQSAPGEPIASQLARALAPFAIFHLTLAIACLTWAILRLRIVAALDVARATNDARVKRKPRRVWNRPILWKELYTKSSFRWHPAIKLLVIALMIFITLAPVMTILWHQRAGALPKSVKELAEAFNAYVRSLGTFVACALLTFIALKAASAITLEREKRTLESLRSTPLSHREILFGKWLGSIAHVRYGLVWLGVIWAIGIWGGGMQLLAILALGTALFVFASFVASTGVLASVLARTSMQAHLVTLGAILCLTLGHLLVWPFLGVNSGIGQTLIEFDSLALTPPYTIGVLAFYPGDFQPQPWTPRDPDKIGAFITIGLVIWAVLAICCYQLAKRSFERASPLAIPFVTRRTAFGRMEDTPHWNSCPATTVANGPSGMGQHRARTTGEHLS